MKKLLTIFLVIFMVSIAIGQEHRTNDYGILFGVGADFLSPPQSIMENGIGAMIHMDNFAIRPIVQFGSTSTDNGAKTSASLFGLGAALIKHMNENRIAPYYGAGFNFTSAKEKNAVEESTSTFAIYALGGVDVYVYKNVTIGAEYQLGYQSMSYKIDYGSSDAESKASMFGFDAVKVIITFFIM